MVPVEGLLNFPLSFDLYVRFCATACNRKTVVNKIRADVREISYLGEVKMAELLPH